MPTLSTIHNDFARLHYAMDGRPDGKIAAKKQKDGTTTFYTSKPGNPKEGIYDLFVGRSLAKKEITKILDSAAQKAPRNEAAQRAFKAAHLAVKKGRIADLRPLMEAIATELTEAFKSPSIAGIGELPQVDTLTHLRPALDNAVSGDVSGAVALLTKSLSASPLCSPDKSTHLPALLAFEQRGRAELVEYLKSASSLPMDDKTAVRIVDTAYRAAVKANFATVEEGKCGRDPGTNNCTNIKEFTLLNGEHCVRDGGEAKEGGFGSAGFFTATDQAGRTRKLIVKLIKPEAIRTTESANLEMLNEAYRQHSANIVPELGNTVMKMEAIVALPDGRWAIVMEAGERGSLHDVKARFEGEDPDLIRVVANDATKMVASFVESGQEHRDFKTANVFVTATGHSKVADFGTAVPAGTSIGEADEKNPMYVDPIAVAAIRDIKQDITVISKKYARLRQDSPKAKLTPQQVADKNRELEKAYARRMEVPNVDTWPLGLYLYEIFAGRDLIPYSTFNTDIEKAQDYFMNPLRIKLERGELSQDVYANMTLQEWDAEETRLRWEFAFPPESTVPVQARPLIMGLLHPDPSKRISAQDVLDSGVFSVPPEKEAKMREHLAFLATLPQEVPNPPADLPPALPQEVAV